MTLEEATAARVAAERDGDTVAWVRARALEEAVLRRGLEGVVHFDPSLHPRDRSGEWRPKGVADPGVGQAPEKRTQKIAAIANRVANVKPPTAEERAASAAVQGGADREKNLRSTLGRLKPGAKVDFGNGITIEHLGGDKFRVRGGVGSATSKAKTHDVQGAKWAARESLDRHQVMQMAKDIGTLPPGHGKVLGTVHVARAKDGHYIVARNAPRHAGSAEHLDRPTTHMSALDAAREVRRHGQEKGEVPETDPKLARKRLKKNVRLSANVAGREGIASQSEEVDRINPADSRADMHGTAAEVGTSGPMTKAPWLGGGEEHDTTAKVALHGMHDPGVSAHGHLAAAQHGKQIMHDAHGHVVDALTKAAPHVGSGKHRAAIKAANHVVSTVGPDTIHTVAHVAQHLFSSRYDEARAARMEAERNGDTTQWVRARALEEALAAKLAEAGDFNPSLHPRNRRGAFIDSLHKLQPHQEIKRNGYKINWLPPVYPGNSIGDPNPGQHDPQFPGAVGGNVFKLTDQHGNIQTRKTPEQVAELVGASGAGKEPRGGAKPVPDIETALAGMWARVPTTTRFEQYDGKRKSGLMRFNNDLKVDAKAPEVPGYKPRPAQHGTKGKAKGTPTANFPDFHAARGKGFEDTKYVPDGPVSPGTHAHAVHREGARSEGKKRRPKAR